MLDVGGELSFRVPMAKRMPVNPETCRQLQHAVRGNNYRRRSRNSRASIDEQSEQLLHAARPARFKYAATAGAARRGRAGREIVKRFATGAM